MALVVALVAAAGCQNEHTAHEKTHTHHEQHYGTMNPQDAIEAGEKHQAMPDPVAEDLARGVSGANYTTYDVNRLKSGQVEYHVRMRDVYDTGAYKGMLHHVRHDAPGEPQELIVYAYTDDESYRQRVPLSVAWVHPSGDYEVEYYIDREGFKGTTSHE